MHLIFKFIKKLVSGKPEWKAIPPGSPDGALFWRKSIYGSYKVIETVGLDKSGHSYWVIVSLFHQGLLVGRSGRNKLTEIQRAEEVSSELFKVLTKQVGERFSRLLPA
jgi:hypothetical protein